jgi:hypothetical protein
MAEIHVKKKDNKGGPVWPWVLGVLLILGLVAWLIIGNTGDRDTDQVAQAPVTATQPADADRAETAAMPAQVAAFINYVDERDAQQEMGLRHEYTANGLRQLESALSELTNQAGLNQNDFQQHSQRMRQGADQIQQDPQSTQHANIIRDAFTSAADWMQNLQQQSFPDAGNEVNQVQQTARNIDPQELTLEQKGDIESFFEQSSNALQAMAHTHSATHGHAGQ